MSAVPGTIKTIVLKALFVSIILGATAAQEARDTAPR